MTEESPDHGSFSAGLIFGVIIGSVSALFLASDKGKELLADLKDKADETIDDISESELVKIKIQEAQEAIERAKKALKQNSPASTSDSLGATRPKSSQPKFFSKSSDSLR